MKKILNIYKPVSLTPLQTIETLKKQKPEYQNKKISYPGRLDPMAEGILILLIEEENKKITQYMKLNKEYRAKFLLGFSTDTYDILGIPKKYPNKEIETNLIKKTIKSFKGNFNQTLPPYSSYKIKGKPLFHYARKNQLPKELPKKQAKILQIKINSIYKINNNKILKQIKTKINNLKGDFRQKEILNHWEKLLKDKQENHQIADITIFCSSGTYIRAIADELGKKIEKGAILFNLIRTQIGKHKIRNSMKLQKPY